MERNVNVILENAPGNKYDVYYILYKECVSTSETPYKTLMQILTYSKSIGVEDDSEPINLSTEEIKDAEHKYIDLINEIVQVLVRENHSEDEFYKRLYEVVFNSSLLPQSINSQAIFTKILSENVRFIPYYQAKNLLQMTNDEYRDYLEKMKPYILEALHMLNRNFDTLTEIASQLYRVAENIEKKEDRIIFISAILGVIMHKQQVSASDEEGKKILDD